MITDFEKHTRFLNIIIDFDKAFRILNTILKFDNIIIKLKKKCIQAD